MSLHETLDTVEVISRTRTSSTYRNLIAGLANSVVSVLVGLTVVPLYIKYLGIEAYGLVGFFVAMQGVLQIFDMGLAPTVNREVARYAAMENIAGVGRLLHTLAIVYWCMALLMALMIVSMAPVIAGHWLNPQHLTRETVVHAVMLMGLIMSCHWPIALYQGTLIGAQRLVITSVISIVVTCVSCLGAITVLAFVSPTISAFFMWQACVAVIHVGCMRWGAWKAVGHSKNNYFDGGELKRIWRFSAGMSGVTISGLVLMQLDKVILSRILTLEDFGRYMLAGAVASGLYIILTPTFNVLYPRLSALVIREELHELTSLYLRGTRLFSAVLFPVATVAVFYSKQLLTLWTQNPSFAASTASVVSLFLIGTTLNGTMHFPYALQLAFGMTRLPLLINMILMIVMIPLTIIFALKYGVIGGAAAWAVLNGIYLVVGTCFTHRTLLKGFGTQWLIMDVGMPLGMSLFVIIGSGSIITKFGFSYITELFVGVLLAVMAFFLIVLLSSDLKEAIRHKFQG